MSNFVKSTNKYKNIYIYLTNFCSYLRFHNYKQVVGYSGNDLLLYYFNFGHRIDEILHMCFNISYSAGQIREKTLKIELRFNQNT